MGPISMKQFNISIVGCGPGDISFVTQAAVNEVNMADCLIGTESQLSLFPSFIYKKIEIGKDGKTIDDLIEMIKNFPGKVVFLTEGDPGVMSIMPDLVKEFGSIIKIIPGISIIQAAFAQIGVSWFGCVMAKAQTSKFSVDRSQVLNSGKLIVILGGGSCFKGVFEFYCTLAQEWRIFIFEEVSQINQRVYEIIKTDIDIEPKGRSVCILLDGTRNQVTYCD